MNRKTIALATVAAILSGCTLGQRPGRTGRLYQTRIHRPGDPDRPLCRRYRLVWIGVGSGADQLRNSLVSLL